MFYVVSLVSGLLFGFGMALSGMGNPDNVIGFLDVAGEWNPSLMFVMGGALMVFLPFWFFLGKKMAAPVCSTEFKLPSKNKVDKPLLLGASFFGVGWGIAGVCPAPAITALAGLNSDAAIFVVFMLLGMKLAGGGRVVRYQLKWLS